MKRRHWSEVSRNRPCATSSWSNAFTLVAIAVLNTQEQRLTGGLRPSIHPSSDISLKSSVSACSHLRNKISPFPWAAYERKLVPTVLESHTLAAALNASSL